MQMHKQLAVADYGPIRKGTYHRVIKEQNDWVLVKHRGQLIYCFRWAFYNER